MHAVDVIGNISSMPESSSSRHLRSSSPVSAGAGWRWVWPILVVTVFGMGVVTGRLSRNDVTGTEGAGETFSEALEQERLTRFSAEDRAERAEKTLLKLEQMERERLAAENLALAGQRDKAAAGGADVPDDRKMGDDHEMLDPTVVGRPLGDVMDAVGEAPPESPLGSGDAREWRSKYRYAALKYNRLVSNYDRLQKKYIELTGADGGRNGIVTGSMFYKVLRRSTREELDRVRKELNGGVSTRRVRDVQSHLDALNEREAWLKRKAREMGIE